MQPVSAHRFPHSGFQAVTAAPPTTGGCLLAFSVYPMGLGPWGSWPQSSGMCVQNVCLQKESTESPSRWVCGSFLILQQLTEGLTPLPCETGRLVIYQEGRFSQKAVARQPSRNCYNSANERFPSCRPQQRCPPSKEGPPGIVLSHASAVAPTFIPALSEDRPSLTISSMLSPRSEQALKAWHSQHGD